MVVVETVMVNNKMSTCIWTTLRSLALGYMVLEFKKKYTLNFTAEHKKKNAMILSVKVDTFLSKDGI